MQFSKHIYERKLANWVLTDTEFSPPPLPIFTKNIFFLIIPPVEPRLRSSSAGRTAPGEIVSSPPGSPGPPRVHEGIPVVLGSVSGPRSASRPSAVLQSSQTAVDMKK